MPKHRLFHGTNGDNILQIIDTQQMRPDASGQIFFSQFDWAPVLQHGADTRRKAAFAICVDINIQPPASLQRKQTPGVLNTLVVRTNSPLMVEVIELIVREPGASQVSPKTSVIYYATIVNIRISYVRS
jgi:hypothetical protein